MEDDEVKLAGEFRLSEIKAAIRRLKPSAAAGPDGIPTWLVKKVLYFQYFIMGLANAILAGKDPSPMLVEGRTVLIPKGGQGSDDPGGYRPITVLNVMYKVVT